MKTAIVKREFTLTRSSKPLSYMEMEEDINAFCIVCRVVETSLKRNGQRQC